MSDSNMRKSKSLNNLSTFFNKSNTSCFIHQKFIPMRPTANFEEAPPSCFIWYGYCPVSAYLDVKKSYPLRS